MLPDQVKLVETLQFLLERKQGKLRVAVVVSAWDLVDNMGIPPNDYIAGQLPLLQQFLVANDDLLDHAVFGVSALGGDITDKAERRRILNLDALKRIMVHQGQETNNDITRPGTTLSTITSRQLITASSAPTTSGATASPALPPMPCTDSTRPLRAG